MASAALPLRAVARAKGRPTDTVAVERALAGALVPHQSMDIARAAIRLGLRPRIRRMTLTDLRSAQLPLLAGHVSGGWFVITQLDQDRVVVHDGDARRPQTVLKMELEAAWSGDAILFALREPSDTTGLAGGLGWIIPTLARYRHVFGQVLLASLLIQVAALITPFLTQVVIDRVFNHGVRATLEVMVIGLVMAACFEAAVSWARSYLFSHTAARIDVELGARLFDHLLKLPSQFFESRRTGHIVARMSELNRVRDFVTSSSMILVIDIAFTIIFFAIMLMYSWQLTIVVAVSVVLYVLLFAAVTVPLRERLDEQFRKSAETQAFLTETVASAVTVKGLALEALMQRSWEDKLAALARAGFQAKLASSWSSVGMDLIMRLTQAAILFFGAGQVIAGDLSVGEYIAFSMFSTRAAQPVMRLAQVWTDFQQFRVSLGRLGELASAPVEAGAADSRTALPKLRGRIAFEDVSFRYPGATSDVITGLTFSAEVGEKVGLVGTSGAGKSTVLKLLLRQLTPTAGRILIDGVDLAEVDPVWLRRQIGWVAQDPVLFTRTIRENIAIARPGLEMSRIVDAARLADVHDFIVQLPKGYDTLLDERGTNLSGGQRQRITIARALIGHPSVLLLDEPTSALDGEARDRLISRLPIITRNGSALIVSHDPNVLRRCDRTLVLGARPRTRTAPTSAPAPPPSPEQGPSEKH